VADFIRDKTVNLKEYLPEYLGKDPQFKTTLAAESDEHEKIRLLLKDILKQFCVNTATWGLDHWESVYGIQSNENESIAFRRERLIQKIRGLGTITLDVMNQLVNSVVPGKDAVVIENVAPNAFRIDMNTVVALPQIREIVETYKPAHLTYIITHSISSTGNLYAGGCISTLSSTHIGPPDDINITVGDRTIYCAGIAHILTTTKVGGL
jgi:hypothetical protein